MVKTITPHLKRKVELRVKGGPGRRLPIRSQLVKVILTLSVDLPKCLNADTVGR